MGIAAGNAQRQRRAVEAIEASGGTVGYAHDFDFDKGHYAKGEPPGPEWLRTLLGRHYFDTVIEVSFSNPNRSGNRAPLGQAAPYLADLPRLRKLHVGYFQPTNDDLGELVARANPEQLSCGMLEISDTVAARIAEADRLKRISLNEVVISASGIAEFERLAGLEEFYLCCTHMYRGPNNELIWDSKRFGIDDEAVDAIVQFKKLRRLSLSFTQISLDGFRRLTELGQLESFSVSSPFVTPEAVDSVVRLKNVTFLGLGGTQIDDAGVPKLSDLKHLKALRLSSAVTNAGLPSVAKLQQLESLDLAGDRINDDGLIHLEGMKNLRRLDLQSTGVTTDGPAVKRLKQALPNCSIRQYYPSPSFR